MAEKSISFRAHLQSNTTDLLSVAGIDCTHTVRLTMSLVSQLAAYTEEGTPLSPSVFVCNSVSELVKRSGVGEYIPLSGSTDMSSSASKILKVAAPLCSGGWHIYVERIENGAACKFGVFCGSNDPSSLTVDDLVLGEENKSFPIVRISQSITNKVEVRTSSLNAVEYRFNDDNNVDNLDNRSLVSNLAAIAASSVGPPGCAFHGFMDRALSSAIRNSHGTLIAVVSGNDAAIPNKLSDAVVLSDPINLHDRYAFHFAENKSAISVSRLQSGLELLSGFINSDGITVLDTHGRILGYRAFIVSSDPDRPSAGGARTRAFGALSSLVGDGLDAAFFRSQDGRMETKFVEKDARDV